MAQCENIFEGDNKVLPRAAVIQDMSGFGRVSLTESIPVLSAMGVEVCPIPTAILSTHTYEYKNYTLLDMTDEMVKIINHWDEIGLKFDAVYSGYMSSKQQTDIVYDFMQKQKKNGAVTVVDPVMGDNVLLDGQAVYSDRMRGLIDGMRRLCASADVITPNLTEACMLTGYKYPKGAVSDGEICGILQELADLGCGAAAITSVMDSDTTMCVALYDGSGFYKIDCGYVSRVFHGTGDIYASVLTGAMITGMSTAEAANVAADFVACAIELTMRHPNMPVRHGVLFEPIIRDGYFSKMKSADRITRLG